MLSGLATASQKNLEQCGLKPAEAGTIVETTATGELSLQDGRKLKLSGIRINSSKSLLSHMVGQNIIPYMAANRPDRTGFTPAHILLAAHADSREPLWLQQMLLQEGHALIYIYPDQNSCADALRPFERIARQAGTGIWKLDLNHPAPTPGLQEMQEVFIGTAGQFDMENATGHYGIIRGLVLSTGSAGRWRYLNFGRSYAQDFTVRLTESVEKRLSDHGFTLKGLKNRTIEVRGVVQSNGGPLIEVFDAAQIVIME